MPCVIFRVTTMIADVHPAYLPNAGGGRGGCVAPLSHGACNQPRKHRAMATALRTEPRQSA